MSEPLLAVRDLKKHYPVTRGLLRREVGRVRAVDGIDLDVYPEETVALVGESGSGKSTAAETILNLDEPTGGTIRFDGRDVTELSRDGEREFRRRTGVVFQDPNESLDPRMRVWETVAEPLEIHGVRDRSERRGSAERMLDRVGLASEADSFPHELSGGQKQRVSLARALVLNPDLLIADEPVSALDVSIQADVLSLIEELKAAFDLAVLFISHDLAIVREITDRVAVMYAGELVEVADAEALFEEPQHPYTRVLMDAIPTTDPSERGQTAELAGEVPDPANPPSGCRFHPRCSAVVRPDSLDLPTDVWQRAFEFRVAVEAGAVDGSDGDPASIRAEYALDGDMPSDVAESVDEAVRAVTGGDEQRAVEIVREALPSPCARDDPELRGTPAGHEAACHHYGRDE